jgi:hypothetical protein
MSEKGLKRARFSHKPATKRGVLFVGARRWQGLEPHRTDRKDRDTLIGNEVDSKYKDNSKAIVPSQ